ncbi:ASCH domain-containing protein [Niallia circulans]|nr:ASCH domain-containing protein [Niallia circulans]
MRQPWATLIALGGKEFETRSWQTKYLGKLAIHAGKSVDKEAWHHKRNTKNINKTWDKTNQ